jgi:hypothetical protein
MAGDHYHGLSEWPREITSEAFRLFFATSLANRAITRRGPETPSFHFAYSALLLLGILPEVALEPDPPD